MMLPTFTLPLPSVSSLSEVSSYNSTVSPFVPQLYELPGKFLQHATSFNDLKLLYLSTNPLIMAFAISLALSPIFLIISEINKNYSQVDRVWSILPTFYIAHFNVWARVAGLPTSRLDMLLAFGLFWSSRLSFNYWRKGGYQKGSEDYRWAILREKIPGPLFFIFNVTFISLAQSVLLFSVSMPAYILLLASRVEGDSLASGDWAAALSLYGLVAFEFLADGQQWSYYSARTKYRETAKVPSGFTREELDRGFNTTGLFAWSRHPNFAAEQSIWVLVYQWSCLATNSFFNWTVLGAISYLILFQSSTIFTESVSAGKYPEYKEYQQQVPMFVPTFINPPKATALEFSGKKNEQKKTK